MESKATNPILQKIEAETRAKVPPELRGAVERIVTAGMKVMYSEQSQHLMLEELQRSPDMADNIGEGIAKLMGILWRESKGVMKPKAMVPAATILLCEALAFVEEAGMVEVDSPLVAACVKEMTSSLLQVMGITPDKLQSIVAKGKQQQGAQAEPPAPVTPPAEGAAPAPVQTQGLVKSAAQGV